MSTNITPDHRQAFEAQAPRLRLFSCFVDGKPGAAIVAVNQVRGVSVTEGTVLTDHDGVRANVGLPLTYYEAPNQLRDDGWIWVGEGTFSSYGPTLTVRTPS